MTNGSGARTPRTREHRVFRSGVASGDPTTTSVVLWTRVHDPGPHAVDVSWSIWTTRGRPVDRGTVRARADDDHICRVVVDGLEPGTAYHYVFEVRGDRIVGRTRTLPAADDHLRIAVACCSRWGWPGFDRYADLLAQAPDLVLHLGDYVYEVGEDPPDGPETDPPHDCVELDDYRRRYRQHRSHPALQRLHAALPFLAVWDDHEVADNAPDDGTADDADERRRRRRAAGQRAWREWMPTRATAEHPRLDRRFRIDGLLDFVLVDSRFGGRPPTDTFGPAVDRPNTALLDESQWRTIEGAVTGDAPWLLVANQVQVSPLTLGWAPALRWPPWRRLVNPDQWDGFPDERRRLVELLARSTSTAVLLSGDLHAGFSRTLLDDGRVVAHELTAPSISGMTFAEIARGGSHLPAGAVRRLLERFNPGIDHLDLERHGFLVVDLTPATLTATFVHHDGHRVTRTLESGA